MMCLDMCLCTVQEFMIMPTRLQVLPKGVDSVLNHNTCTKLSLLFSQRALSCLLALKAHVFVMVHKSGKFVHA